MTISLPQGPDWAPNLTQAGALTTLEPDHPPQPGLHSPHYSQLPLTIRRPFFTFFPILRKFMNSGLSWYLSQDHFISSAHSPTPRLLGPGFSCSLPSVEHGAGHRFQTVPSGWGCIFNLEGVGYVIGCAVWFLNRNYWLTALEAYPWNVGQGSKRSPGGGLNWSGLLFLSSPHPRWFAESAHWLLVAGKLEQAERVLKEEVHIPGRKTQR